MVEYRAFLNTDPPWIVDLWRRQRPLRAIAESLNRDLFDRCVLAKPYFDRNGLILAIEGEQPVGFVHAGFGPNSEHTDLDRRHGVIAQVRVLPERMGDETGPELIRRAEDYLRQQGAEFSHAGSWFPFAPFYLGLYGGSRIPGVLVEDLAMAGSLERAGYMRGAEVGIFSRNLAGFRNRVDRNLINARRNYRLGSPLEWEAESWWDCCSLGMAERDVFTMVHRRTNQPVGRVVYWDMLPLAGEWGVSARGIFDLQIDPEHRDEKLELFLLGESMKQLHEQGVGLIEAQTPLENREGIAILEQLGFHETGRGAGWSKRLADPFPAATDLREAE